MADSFLSINNQATPGLTQPSADSQNVDNATNMMVGGVAQEVNNDMYTLDRSRLEAQRTQIVAQEQQHQADLALPKSLLAMKENTVSAVNQIAAIAEARKAADQQQDDQVWTTSKTVDMETGFNDYLRQAKANAAPDGKGFQLGVQGWLNDYEKSAMDDAPSNNAALSLYAKSSAFKIQALNSAGNFEGLMRAKNRLDVSNNSVNSLAQQAYQDPTALPSALSQINDITNSIKGDLQTPEQAQQFSAASKSTLYMAGLKGALQRNDYQTIDNMYSSKELQSTVPSGELDAFMTKAAQSEDKYIKGQQTATLGDQLTQAFDNNQLTKGTPGSEKVATQSFVNYLSTKVGDTSQLKPENVSSVSTQLIQYFNDHNAYTSSQVRGMIAGKINGSSNPSESAAYALTVNALSKDPTGTGQNIINDIDTKTRLKSYDIADAMEATGDPVRSMQIANDMAQSRLNSNKADINAELAVQGNKQWMSDKMNVSYDKLFNTQWIGSPLTDDQKASGALELEAKTKGFMSAGNNFGDSLKLAGDEIKKDRAVTSINGATEVMVGAPELYYPKNILPTVTDILRKGAFNYANNNLNPDGSKPNIGVMGWNGITQFQSNSERWYMLKNMDTGQPIVDKAGGYQVIPVKMDMQAAEYKMAGQVKALQDQYQPSFLQRWISSKARDTQLENSDGK